MEKQMTTYLVRRSKYAYELAKFEDSSYPLDIYRISGSRCYCPARTRSCKHMKIFKTWERSGSVEGDVYDESGYKLNNIFTN